MKKKKQKKNRYLKNIIIDIFSHIGYNMSIPCYFLLYYVPYALCPPSGVVHRTLFRPINSFWFSKEYVLISEYCKERKKNMKVFGIHIK